MEKIRVHAVSISLGRALERQSLADKMAGARGPLRLSPVSASVWMCVEGLATYKVYKGAHRLSQLTGP
jgi:hypothetical protein